MPNVLQDQLFLTIEGYRGIQKYECALLASCLQPRLLPASRNDFVQIAELKCSIRRRVALVGYEFTCNALFEVGLYPPLNTTILAKGQVDDIPF